jgi:beta-phosphoglucomutase family hydrolase
MSPAGPSVSPERFDAVLFDLDGVLTATAKVHAVCWKKTFDDFLQRWAHRSNKPFQPFDLQADYEDYVDGKPRYDGVRSFLESRGIQLPPGDPDDPPGRETVCGLGNRKDDLFGQALAADGVEVFPGSVAWIRQLRQAGIKTAVVSSSRHCLAVIQAAGISDLFDARVDGQVADDLKLAGKPAPATFLQAAQMLGVQPQRAVVVEDAISGVQAGRHGGFGLVIGVDRKGDAEALRGNGADMVVRDLKEMLT